MLSGANGLPRRSSNASASANLASGRPSICAGCWSAGPAKNRRQRGMTTGERCGCWQRHSITGQTGGRIWMGHGAGWVEAGDRRKSPILIQADFCLCTCTLASSVSANESSNCTTVPEQSGGHSNTTTALCGQNSASDKRCVCMLPCCTLYKVMVMLLNCVPL